MPFLKYVLGRRLANEEQNERKITAFEGVPAMGLDGLGSSSYGPEAALTVLTPLGAAGLAYIGVVMLPILALLLRFSTSPIARPSAPIRTTAAPTSSRRTISGRTPVCSRPRPS